ncbi:DUF1330 domain-containing protein [Limnobacter parvus]|uniref:DUF1330 domain-containing protein n=1 Tax=Limnobacter parvus TaxID=2939690 RepID=A0ABT1XKY9_9BURK|nr:DUF1330 domain-containing protein [Limnobacter parvus]MCR2747526.1 DUF1330 domain-containing protein [Limnobacter parvus]
MSESNAAVFMVGQIKIIDPARWQQYRDQVADTLTPWGAKVIFRGKQTEVFALSNPYTDIVIIQFPNSKAASGWFHSPAYQAIIPLRESAAEVVLTSYKA